MTSWISQSGSSDQSGDIREKVCERGVEDQGVAHGLKFLDPDIGCDQDESSSDRD